jgi:hypothetical protein
MIVAYASIVHDDEAADTEHGRTVAWSLTGLCQGG